jgi:hypothetical protein
VGIRVVSELLCYSFSGHTARGSSQLGGAPQARTVAKSLGLRVAIISNTCSSQLAPSTANFVIFGILAAAWSKPAADALKAVGSLRRRGTETAWCTPPGPRYPSSKSSAVRRAHRPEQFCSAVQVPTPQLVSPTTGWVAFELFFLLPKQSNLPKLYSESCTLIPIPARKKTKNVLDQDVPYQLHRYFRANQPNDDQLEARSVTHLQLVFQHLEHAIQDLHALV